MTGELDLGTLLREMRPILDAKPYVIASVQDAIVAELRPNCIGMFHEAEGVTLILIPGEAARIGLPIAPQWAHITLSVHSSLSAVGFIAPIATALASAGISLNPVAGFYHDHLFVPWSDRHEALAVLRELAKTIRQESMAVDQQYPELLFSYGTLQLEAVQMATFGRQLAGTSDALRGFDLVSLEIEDQAVVAISGTAHHTMARFTGRASDVVSGMVFAVSAEEIQNADEYEVPAVKRVAVELQSGVRAWAYVDVRSGLPQ